MKKAVDKTLAEEGPVFCEIFRFTDTELRAEERNKASGGWQSCESAAGGSGTVPSTGGSACQPSDPAGRVGTINNRKAGKKMKRIVVTGRPEPSAPH